MKKTINSPMFRALYRAHQGKCFYCDKKMLSPDGKNDDLTVDHFIPLAKGGSNCKTNYVLACKACNSVKADKMPSAKYKSKKFIMFKYIKHNQPDIFRMNFKEKKSFFEIKRMTGGNTNEINKIQAA